MKKQLIGFVLAFFISGGAFSQQVPTPKVRPAGGVFKDRVVVNLVSSVNGAIIRWTSNGEIPTASSELYSAPIILRESTTIKARAFLGDRPSSEVANATFVINSSEPTIIENNGLVEGLEGPRRGQRLFKIAIPRQQKNFDVQLTIPSGNADLYVRRGQAPTTSNWDYRSKSHGGERVTVRTPAASDWYILINGQTAYFGASLQVRYEAATQTKLPDLVPSMSELDPFTSTEYFYEDDCDVIEGHIEPGERRLLRFTGETRNMGKSDLVLGDPAENPLFDLSSCHGHYHFDDFAFYTLKTSSGRLVGRGTKVGFCIEDVSQFDDSVSDNPQYDCDYQGLQIGWADIYSGYLPGQWIDITGLAPGSYVLEIKNNPEHLIEESNYNNNVMRAKVTIKSTDDDVSWHIIR